MSQLHQSRSGAITVAVELAALFDSEGEWEPAEQTRVLLYHFLRGNYSAARAIFESLSDRTGERLPAKGARNRIAHQLGRLALVLQPSEQTDYEQDL